MSRGRWLHLLGVPCLILALYFVVPISSRPTGGLALRVGCSLLALAALALVLGRLLGRQIRDGGQRVEALISAIVLVLVTFALAFHVLDLHHPDQVAGIRTRLDALYFSASTMLTIGYGDAHAVGQTARAIVLVQIAFDVVYVAVAARLLSLRITTVGQREQQRRSERREPGDPGGTG